MIALQVPKPSEIKNNLNNQVLYAPFVKPGDKVRRDTTDMSFSDFQPKRLALAYDPPVIVIEYLVPSTGKLYHHKMRMRQLTADSDIDQMVDYLEKRHPLYFTTRKVSKTQIWDLVRRMKYRL
jgi:centrosomal protein CEP19